jgi:hypothetical protein
MGVARLATVHVMPVDDLIEHDNSGITDCPCGPATEPVKATDGDVSWLITHNALDGRELAERRAARTTDREVDQ